MKQVKNGKLYNTDTAMLIASDRYWDGHNFDRNGRNTFLFKTQKGNFFLLHTTRWQGEADYIEPISKNEAKRWYEELREQKVDYTTAFDEEPEEA